ncbi:MAG: DUF2284 domain-containing protein [Clostridia bacterium]|nr:DUF2284 domain-containing protein [Clostridia bacterium]
MKARIKKYLERSDIFQYSIFSTELIPFSQSVVDACRANLCGKYGTCWTCPPGVGEMSVLEKRIKSYENAAVFTCKYSLEDSFDFEGMVEGQKQTRNIFREILSSLSAAGESFYALGCEGCDICEKCTYPDAPCRFPEKAIPSIEACGISVVELSKLIGVNYNNGPCTVTYFCMILF